MGGWGKPLVNAFGRPLYSGNPFDMPETKYEGGGFDGENEDLYGLSGGGMAAASSGGLVRAMGVVAQSLW